MNKKPVPYLYYVQIHKPKNTCLWIFNKMYENTVTVGFLRCKPNVCEFLYNLFVNFHRHLAKGGGGGSWGKTPPLPDSNKPSLP